MTITNDGVQEVINFLASETAVEPSHMAAGTDSTAASQEDTALGNEKLRSLIEITSSTADSVTFTITVLTTQGNGNALREAGLFSAATAGVMFNRFIHSTITKSNVIELQYEITLKVKGA